MVTDIAPIDLILQRAGRLHRHLWRDSESRGVHQIPHLFVYEHRARDGSLNLHADKAIYAEYFLRKTIQELSKADKLCLPADYRSLISAVYDSLPPEPLDALYPAWRELKKSESQDKQEANFRLLPNQTQMKHSILELRVSLSRRMKIEPAGLLPAHV